MVHDNYFIYGLRVHDNESKVEGGWSRIQDRGRRGKYSSSFYCKHGVTCLKCLPIASVSSNVLKWSGKVNYSVPTVKGTGQKGLPFECNCNHLCARCGGWSRPTLHLNFLVQLDKKGAGTCRCGIVWASMVGGGGGGRERNMSASLVPPTGVTVDNGPGLCCMPLLYCYVPKVVTQRWAIWIGQRRCGRVWHLTYYVTPNVKYACQVPHVSINYRISWVKMAVYVAYARSRRAISVKIWIVLLGKILFT